MSLTHQQWNMAIDLWNDGKSLGEIATAIEVPVYQLSAGSSILGLSYQIAREYEDKGIPADVPIYIPDSYKRKWD